MAGIVLSKGSAILPAFSVDEYGLANNAQHSSLGISQGRFSAVALQLLLDELGLRYTQINWPALLLLFLATSAVVAICLEFASRQNASVWLLASLAALFCSHPYFTEYFTFRAVASGLGLALLSISVAVLVLSDIELSPDQGVRKFLLRLAPAIPLIIVAAGFFQQTFLLVAMAIIGRTTLDSVDQDGRLTIMLSLKRNLAGMLALIGSGVGYLVVVGTTQRLASVEMTDRGRLLPPSQFSERLAASWDLIVTLVWRDEVVASQVLKVVMIMAFMMMLIRVAATSVKRFFVLIGLTTTLAVLGLSLVVVSSVWWPVPRAIYAVVFSYVVVMAVAGGWVVKPTWVINILLIMAAVLSAAHSAAMLSDQSRINRFDVALAQSLAERLEATGKVGADTQVVLVAPSFYYPVGVDTVFGDTNISSLAVPWGADGLFEEATGRKWNVIVSAGGDFHCDPTNVWPSPSAVQTIGDRIVVCMGAA